MLQGDGFPPYPVNPHPKTSQKSQGLGEHCYQAYQLLLPVTFHLEGNHNLSGFHYGSAHLAPPLAFSLRESPFKIFSLFRAVFSLISTSSHAALSVIPAASNPSS